jgi:hypothetical protein
MTHVKMAYLGLVVAMLGIVLSACEAAPEPAVPVDDEPVAAIDEAVSTDFCWLPSNGRGVGTVPTECPAGTEQNGALCYPTCQAGFYGVGPVCWQSCPAGMTDDGAFCRKDAVIFGKPSYGRGAGFVPNACNPGDEKNGALCYPACQAGFYGVGPVCWQSCAPGYADNGASCFQHIFSWYFKASYGRGAGYAPGACPGGTQYDAGLCYSTCAGGYYGVGPVCWGTCPSGFTDDGATCRKDAVIIAKATYGRGAGSPMVCSSNLQYDAGLCYQPCAANQHGIGPVCWGTCPAGMVACGAGCASSAGTCSNAIISQITSVLDVATNLASAVVSFGGSTAARAAVTATVKLTLSAEGRAVLRQKILDKLVEQAAGAIAMETLETTAEAMTHAAEVGTLDATALDPTGIAAVVQAFDHPVCGL